MEESKESVTARYTQLDAHDASKSYLIAAGTETLAFADDSGSVSEIQPSGYQQIVTRPNIRDLAVGEFIYVLTDTELEAFGRAGGRLWVVDIPNGEGIIADATRNQVYIRTDDATFLSIDGQTGSETARFDQPHTELGGTPTVAAHGGYLAVATWSFMTILSPSGEVAYDNTVDGAVSDVGLFDDRAVVVYKDGRAECINEFESFWTLSPSIEWVAQAGDGSLIVSIDETPGTVSEDGHTTTIDGLHGRPVAATVDQRLIATISDDTLAIHSTVDQGEQHVELEITSGTIRTPNPTATLEVRNTGTVPVDLTATIEADGATLSTPSLELTVSAESRERRQIRLHDLTADAVTLSVTTRTAATKRRLDVDHAEVAIKTERSFDQISHDTLTATVTVTNVGDLPVTEVTVADDELRALEPKESHSQQVTQPLPSGAINVTTAETGQHSVDLALPVAPTEISLQERTEGLLGVVLANETPAPLEDTITISNAMTADTEIERTVEIPASGQYQLEFPVVEAGTRTVEINTSGGHISREVALSRCSFLPPLEPDTSKARVNRREQQTPDQAPSTDSVSLDTDAGGPQFTLEHKLLDEELRIGQLGEEAIRISNKTDEQLTGTVRSGDSAESTFVSIEPDEKWVGHRQFVSYASEVTLPAIQVETDEMTETIDQRQHTVTETPLQVLISATAPDNSDHQQLTYVAQNVQTGDSATEHGPCELLSLEVSDYISFDIERTVAVGESITGEIEVPAEKDLRKKSIGVKSVYKPTSTASSYNALIANAAAIEQFRPRLAGLTVTPLPEAGVREGIGALYVKYENETGRKLPGIAIDATGPQVQSTAYRGDKRPDALAAGESVGFVVDIGFVDSDEQIEVTLTVTTEEGDKTTHTVHARTDADANVAPDEWTIEDKGGGFTFPEVLYTKFE